MAIIAIIMIYPSVTLKIINVMTAAKLISVSVIIVIGIVKLSKGQNYIIILICVIILFMNPLYTHSNSYRN